MNVVFICGESTGFLLVPSVTTETARCFVHIHVNARETISSASVLIESNGVCHFVNANAPEN